MLTHIDIDQDKLQEIMELKGYKTKKEAVNAAIDEYLKAALRSKVLFWKGSNAWEGNLDEMRKD